MRCSCTKPNRNQRRQDMLKEERFKIIMKQINLHNKVLSVDLSKLLNVSEDTIRRDLKELADGGHIVRVHGGAISKSLVRPFIADVNVYSIEEKRIIAAKAVAFREALKPEFKTYQEQVLKNATALSEALKEKGFRLVSNGTDTHLMLVDLRPKKVTGKAAEKALDRAGITVNKNTIPFDPEKPFVASGIRVGTPALTTRGMKESDMKIIAEFIDRVIINIENEEEIESVKKEVSEFTANFPLVK